jgi:hypothetical protein
MPNWSDENGLDWFGKLECKRCLRVFTADKQGEVPAHQCLGGWFASASGDDVWHYPIRVDKPSGKRGKRP